MPSQPPTSPSGDSGRFAAVLQRLGDARRHGGARLPPGPPEPGFVQALRWVRDPIAFMDGARARYGRVFTARLAAMPPLIHFAEPEAIREIFAGPADLFYAGEANRILGPVLGTGSLLLLDGDPHRRHRRLLTPPFHGQRMQTYGAAIAEISERAIAAWPRDRPIALLDQTRAIALDVILKTVFGLGDGDDIAGMQQDMSELVALAMSSPLFLFPFAQIELGPLTSWSRIVKHLRSIDGRLFTLIEQRKAAPPSAAPRDDVLSLLLSARDEEGQPMTPQELRDELMTLLVAGHDTVATGLAWTVHHLLDNPQALERALRELADHGQSAADPAQSELPWLDAVIKEALRLTPVLPVVGRRLQIDMRIGGVDLPAGVRASPNVYLMHRDPDLWPHPEYFDPSRFLDSRPPAHHYFPFGGGVRRCIGMAFAMFEMRIVLATLLRRLTLERPAGVTVRPVRQGVALAPSDGMPLIVRDRG